MIKKCKPLANHFVSWKHEKHFGVFLTAMLLLILLAISTVFADVLDRWIPEDYRIRGREMVKFTAGDRLVPVVDGEFVVIFRNRELALYFAPFNQYDVKTFAIHNGMPDLDTHRVVFPPGLDMPALLRAMMSNPYVNKADPNVMVFTTAYYPTDSDFSLQWPLHNDGSLGGIADADINAPVAWDYTTGDSGVDIYVIDTGIAIEDATGNLSHPDLNDSSRINLLANVIGNTYYTTTTEPVDEYGHGTHVAGIIGAEMDGGGSTTGLCPECSLQIIKAIDIYGLSTLSDQWASLAIAIIEAWPCGSCAPTPSVINMSWHLAEGYEIAGYGTIESLIAIPSTWGLTNILFVASAGNHDYCPSDRPVLYPAAYSASYDEMIAVSATDWDDEPVCTTWWGSAFGPEVTVAAAGEEVYSTLPGYPTMLSEYYGYSMDYDCLSGTSMAAPHVAGLAGLIWSGDSSLTAIEVREIIIDGADQVGSYAYDASGRNDYMGYGRIDAGESVVLGGCSPSCTVISCEEGYRSSSKGLALLLSLFPYAMPLMGILLLRRSIRIKKTDNRN